MIALDRTAPCTVHWLPCSILHTGEAPVSSYFMPQPAAGKRLPVDAWPGAVACGTLWS